MPSLQATEQRDDRELVETRDGWRGRRVYRVNTGDADTALLGNGGGPPPGLPAKGDSWDDVTAPYLVCVNRKTRRQGGQNTDTDNNTGGWTLVSCEYETLGLHGGLPPPASGISFTRLAPQTTSIQAFYCVDPSTGAVDQALGQIANGRGAPVDAGTLTFEVFSPLAPGDLLPLSRVNTLHTLQQVNDAEIDLPPLLQQQTGFTLAAGQLRMAGFGVDDPDETGWRYVRYLLRAALDHKQRWFVEGADGGATGELRVGHVYTYGDFSGLW